ncbi:MAG: gamma-glutamyltransferase [Phycisphaerales bacterium]
MHTPADHPARRTFIFIITAATLAIAAAPHHLPSAHAQTPPNTQPRPHESRPLLTPGVVATDHPLASWAGVQALNLGGNAVDAAVAASFALSVVRPESCGIGGGGFMVIHLRDDPRTPEPDDPISIAIDYRERAPAAITPGHFTHLPEGASQHSGHAIAIPATTAGLLLALETFGTLDRMQVLIPAITIARKGWIVDAYQHEALAELAQHADQHADAYTAEQLAFIDQFTNHRSPLPGQLIRNPQHAETLERIARHGLDAFYQGPIAQAIIDTIHHHQGVMTLDDLAAPPAGPHAAIVEPLIVRIDAWNQRTFITMPLPSSGGITLIQMLTLLAPHREALEAAIQSRDAPAAIHLIAETMKHAFADRAAFLADPQFNPDIDTQALLNPRILAARAQRITPNQTLPTNQYGLLGDTITDPNHNPANNNQLPPQLPDDAGTSHFSILDRWGNAVACTETINLLFGSRIPVARYGFFLNNQMDDFATQPDKPNAFGLIQSQRNAPEPGKRPLSSMTPTIVLDHNQQVEFVAGASGGPRIITATFQALIACMTADPEAAAAPQLAVEGARIHHQWLPETLFIEAATPNAPRSAIVPIGALNAEAHAWTLLAYNNADFTFGFAHTLYAALQARGHRLAHIKAAGIVQLIAPVQGEARGFADPRKGGSADEATP